MSRIPKSGIDPTRRLASALSRAALASLLVAAAAPAAAWVFTIERGPRELFLMVGVGSAAANNATINTVSVTVPLGSVGSGAAQTMTSDSTQSSSPHNNFAVCNPPAQVYIGGSYRAPNASVGAGSALLQVTTPANLTSAAHTIPFSQISWTSTANGNATADIPAGTFNGGTLVLKNIPRNRFVENCFTYVYANTVVAPAGTFTGRAVFTLTVP